MAYGTAGLVQVYFQAEVEFIAVERVSHYIAIPPEEEESAAERQGGEAQTTVRAVSKGPQLWMLACMLLKRWGTQSLCMFRWCIPAALPL